MLHVVVKKKIEGKNKIYPTLIMSLIKKKIDFNYELNDIMI